MRTAEQIDTTPYFWDETGNRHRVPHGVTVRRDFTGAAPRIDREAGIRQPNPCTKCGQPIYVKEVSA